MRALLAGMTMDGATDTAAVRRRAAAAARDVLAGAISFAVWTEQFGDHADAEIQELEDLLQHMPAKPWRILRGSVNSYSSYQAELEIAIQRLEEAR